MASIGLQRLGPLKGQERARLWMSTPKRIAKRAVDRNLVKRVLRAQWQSHPVSQINPETSAYQFLAKLQTLPTAPRGQLKRMIALDAISAFDASYVRSQKSKAGKSTKATPC